MAGPRPGALTPPASNYRVAALFRYPLKSGAGVRCPSVSLDRFGVRDDRRWMLVDPLAGQPITQREIPKLARLEARRSANGLELRWSGPSPAGEASIDGQRLQVEEPPRNNCRLPVTIWGDTVHLPIAADAANDWITASLGREARIAFMPDDVERPVNPRYARAEDRTTLTDGYPLHLIGSGSMEDLNDRLDEPVGVERFRPNLLIDGPPPFDEDDWGEVRVGGCKLRVVKPCPRCSVTTVDPATGERGVEPLRTLSTYRKREGGVMFGQNALHDGEGTIRVGDPVEVLSRRAVSAG